jgi:Lysine methyltransferase
VCGLILARAFPNARVHLTDLPALQGLLGRNAATTENATFGVLEWGKEPAHDEGGDGTDDGERQRQVSAAPKYDVILGADVVAGIYDSSGLAKTIFDLSHDESRIVLSYRERLSGLMDRFEAHLRELFVHVERLPPDSDNRNPDVFLLWASGKRNTLNDG